MKQVMTALITPFHEEGSIDFDALRTLVKSQLDAGIDGFIVCGTTGETPTLTMEEREAVIDCVLDIDEPAQVPIARPRPSLPYAGWKNTRSAAICSSRHITAVPVRKDSSGIFRLPVP